jgi:hypothetical protein
MISKAVEVMPPLSLIREQPARRAEFLTWVLDDASEQGCSGGSCRDTAAGPAGLSPGVLARYDTQHR